MELKWQVIGSILGTLATVYTVLRWLLWPRAENLIREEVEKALRPYRDSITKELSHLATEIGKLASVLETIKDSQTKMAISQTETKTKVDLIIEDRRQGPHDRRRSDS